MPEVPPLNQHSQLYTPTVGVSDSRDLLVFLKRIHIGASLNSEGLRKQLVKKFDKQLGLGRSNFDHFPPPDLYTANFSIGLHFLESAIDILRELLDYLDDTFGSNLLTRKSKHQQCYDITRMRRTKKLVVCK